MPPIHAVAPRPQRSDRRILAEGDAKERPHARLDLEQLVGGQPQPDQPALLALVDGEDAGTVRLRVTPGGHCKAERVAVRAAWRRRGIGRLLMRALEEEARARSNAEITLHAQLAVIDFYMRLGYAPEGGDFFEAGIVHRAMRKRLA
jgi:GNAT superfamily N-acetyltransferase